MKVYLAGTINTEPWTKEWRDWMTDMITFSGHDPLNPMRYQNPATFTRDGLGDESTPASFFWKVDMGDLKSADVVVAHYRRAASSPIGESTYYRRQSVGTWMELGIAAWEKKPIIVITDDPDVRDHPAIQQNAAIVVSTVEEAWIWLAKILDVNPNYRDNPFDVNPRYRESDRVGY